MSHTLYYPQKNSWRISSYLVLFKTLNLWRHIHFKYSKISSTPACGDNVVVRTCTSGDSGGS